MATYTVTFAAACPEGEDAVSVSLYFAAFVFMLTGIATPCSTGPPSQANVAGRPATALFDDSVHEVAPDTEAVTVVAPPDGTLAGVAVRPEITGFVPLAAAGDAPAAAQMPAAITTRAVRANQDAPDVCTPRRRATDIVKPPPG
jgi:hypothetical protein